jgi:hypothetical protein
MNGAVHGVIFIDQGREMRVLAFQVMDLFGVLGKILGKLVWGVSNGALPSGCEINASVWLVVSRPIPAAMACTGQPVH